VNVAALFRLGLRLIQRGLKTDGAVNRRLAENLAEAEHDQAGEEPNEHSTYEKCPNHGRRFLSVARESKQVAPIVHEFMHVHALNKRCRTFFHADKIDRQQC